MILIALGRWNHSAGCWLIRERIWWRGYRWTPFVRARWRYSWKYQRENLMRWIADHLPHQVVYFAVIRAWANATTGQWSHIKISVVKVTDLLERWENNRDDQG